MRTKIFAVSFLSLATALGATAQEISGLTINQTPVSSTTNRVELSLDPMFAIDRLTVLSATAPGGPYTTNAQAFAGYNWSNLFTGTARYFKVEAAPLSENRQWAAAVLNRMCYGPTPTDVFNLMGTNPSPTFYYIPGTTDEAYISNAVRSFITNQLNPAGITDNVTNTHANLANLIARQSGAADFVRTNETTGPGTANLGELRSWYTLNGVHSKRQLLQQLDQFFENLHVTQWSKARDFFAGPYNGIPNVADRQASRFDWLDAQARRAALMNSSVTFSNLLLLQAESPAMTIYLDTQTSRSDGNNVANENYAREIMELFAMGVDNGYDQTDITEMAPCWTGWQVRFVSVANAGNFFAPQHTQPSSNNVGVWRTVFDASRHGTTNTFNTNYIFFNRNSNGVITGPKSVPARFGAPWTQVVYPGTGSLGPLGGGGANGPGQYGLYIPPQGTFGSTNNIQDGYIIVRHLANLPFTQEFVTAKLCQWFVHDNFPFGPVNGFDFSTNHVDTSRPWYNDSPEGRLMRQCMLAWENNTPKGQLYKVLDVIFNSDLFKTNAYANKIKTPLEFTISTIRSIKQSTNDTDAAGSWTADTDGYSLTGSAGGVANPTMRMGDFGLYDRETPDGFPEYGQAWLSAGTLAERVRFAQAFLMPVGTLDSIDYTTAKNDGMNTGNPAGAGTNRNISDPIALINKRLTPTEAANPAAIADMFVNLIFPGEGRANIDLYRRAAIDFLFTDATGATSPYGSQSAAQKEVRIRGMVATLLAFQRFNEQ